MNTLHFSQSIHLGHSSVHVRLFGLPRTATPADITRLLAKNKVHNITKGVNHAV